MVLRSICPIWSCYQQIRDLINQKFSLEWYNCEKDFNPPTLPPLKVTLLGKILLELGLFGDGTSFGEFDIKDICKELQEIGYESKGNELLYDGLNGEQFKTFYYNLKYFTIHYIYQFLTFKINLTFNLWIFIIIL